MKQKHPPRSINIKNTMEKEVLVRIHQASMDFLQKLPHGLAFWKANILALEIVLYQWESNKTG